MSRPKNVQPLTRERVPPPPPPGCPVGYPDCGARDGDPTPDEESRDKLSDTKERRTEDGALRPA